MNRQILDVVKAVSYEMDVEKTVIFEAIEAALEIATKKRHLTNRDVKVEIDRETGNYTTFRRWQVMAEDDAEIEYDSNMHLYLSAAEALLSESNILKVYDCQEAVEEKGDEPKTVRCWVICPEAKGKEHDEKDEKECMTLAQAKEQGFELQLGDYVLKLMDSIEFGRIAAQTAKQVIVQKVREAKRNKIIDAYRERLGQLISGIVKRVSREGITLDLGDNAEVLIPREEMLPNEMVHSGDRLRAYLYDIRSNTRGPQLFASRAKKEMLHELFKIEVPEIGEEVIEIKSIARDPGSRAKIAVKTNDGRIDPIGACVGMRGARVQVISNELGGERIDIILWDDNAAQLVINAMSPAEVASIMMDEDTKTMDIAVEEEQLSQAIGRSGQNVRLASELTGWTLNVMSVLDAEKKTLDESDKVQKMFAEKLEVDEDIAGILVREGFTTVEEIAYVPVHELSAVAEFDEEIVEALRERAKEAITKDDDKPKPADDLLEMKGMDQGLAYTLAAKGIVTMEDLAEQAVDDLMEVEGMIEKRAAKLIMTAREPWFKD